MLLDEKMMARILPPTADSLGGKRIRHDLRPTPGDATTKPIIELPPDLSSHVRQSYLLSSASRCSPSNLSLGKREEE